MKQEYVDTRGGEEEGRETGKGEYLLQSGLVSWGF